VTPAEYAALSSRAEVLCSDAEPHIRHDVVPILPHTEPGLRKVFVCIGVGCCQACDGTGASGDDAVPSGQCWDCRGTGHAHEGPCTP
jgi:hypothetical protein